MESEQDEINVEINGPITAAENGSLTNSSFSMMDGATSQMDELVRNSHKVPYFYRQDIVRHNKSGSIGMVHDIAGDSDSDSSIADDNDYDDDEDDDDDDGDENEEGEGDDGEDHVDDNKNSDEDKGGDSYKGKKLQADQVRILWLDDTEQIQHVNNITLIDRGFLHGDYVASALEPTGQVGLVQDVNICVDLLAPDGSIVQNVSSRDLKRVREFAVGDYVVLGPWLGRVDDVLDNVVVLVDDGSLCKVIGADPLHLKPISKNYLDEDGQFPYYPGQRVRASSSSVFKNSRWLSGLWNANRLEGTVTKVTVGSLYIHWIASAGYGPNSSTVPAEKQSPKNLKLLSCFAHANWQVGDWCVVPLSVFDSSSITLDKNLSKLWLHDFTKTESQLENGCDSEELTQKGLDEVNELMDLDQANAPDANGVRNIALPESSSCRSSTSVTKDPVHETRHLHRKKIRKVVIRKDTKARKKEEKFEKAFLIVKTWTTIHVAWQDGTIGHEVDSKMLIPIDSPGDHEFVAEQYVVEKASDDIDNTSEPKRVGVVRNVNAKQRTACVRWLKPVEQMEDPCEFDVEEIVSVYELESHPDYDYTYGDVVVRLSPVSVSALSNEESAVETKQQIGEGKSQRFAGSKKGENPSGDEASMDSLSLSWVGNITGLRNGDIEVMWADGMISTVGPQAIFVVGRDDDDSIADGSEVSDDSASWETVNDDENPQEEVGPADASSMNPEVEESRENGNFGRNRALSLPLAAIDFVTRLAAGIFSRRKNEDQGFSNSKGKDEFQSEERDSSDESSSQKSNVINNYCAESTHEKGEECADDDAPITSNIAEGSGHLNGEIVEDANHLDDDTSHFKRFDTAKDPLDHHFLGSSGQISNGRKWLKKVQQDWDILQNNLPDGIYVRVYEDQMDLLRAVIVGAYGTPYQDGLFFFDFYLPPDYPDVPPSAHYHSGGWRINPNLYEEGKVCLSLLNTWTGRGNEVWDPKSSSILQVLVSLQGLVLNSKPYFNEAGYDKQIGTPEGEKNSVSYNENTFLLNCKTMMYLMRRPPKDFEELVREHFKKRGFYILRACDAYMKGGFIGSLSKDASISVEDNSNSTSVGFKLMLDKIMPKLYSALIDVGADCLDFKHLLHSEK